MHWLEELVVAQRASLVLEFEQPLAATNVYDVAEAELPASRRLRNGNVSAGARADYRAPTTTTC